MPAPILITCIFLNIAFLQSCIQHSVLDFSKRSCFFLGNHIKHLRLHVHLSVPCSINRLTGIPIAVSWNSVKDTHTHKIDTAKPTSSLTPALWLWNCGWKKW